MFPSPPNVVEFFSSCISVSFLCERWLYLLSLSSRKAIFVGEAFEFLPPAALDVTACQHTKQASTSATHLATTSTHDRKSIPALPQAEILVQKRKQAHSFDPSSAVTTISPFHQLQAFDLRRHPHLSYTVSDLLRFHLWL